MASLAKLCIIIAVSSLSSAVIVQRNHVIASDLEFNNFLRLASVSRGPVRTWNPCQTGACYPATGNLLVGRGNQLSASSTCGLNQKDRFCIPSISETSGNRCYYCDSRNDTVGANHRIQSVLSRVAPGTNRRSWWQSENGIDNVSIRLDLESKFQFTHLLATFKTFRPAAMLIERSSDFGKTWKVYRYFASNCAESFPGIPTTPQTSLSDVICESRYSSLSPSTETEGEVIFRAIPRNVMTEPFSPEVLDLIRITNLRINFTKLHTLGDDLSTSENKDKYYYALYDMTVRGSCDCNGHASKCIPLENGEKSVNAGMIYGRCECAHNTKGVNCEECDDLYRDLPWMPAVGTKTNACKRCECNNHASSCHFDAAVYEASGKISGGVCDNCQHNTTGNKCDECQASFYRNPGKHIFEIDACQPCECNPEGSLNNICDSLTGQCTCRPGMFGRDCSSSSEQAELGEQWSDEIAEQSAPIRPTY